MIKVNRLPQGYKELEYVDGSNGAYIKTDILPAQVDEAIMEMAITSTDSGQQYFMGARRQTGTDTAIGYAIYFVGHGNGINYYPLSWVYNSSTMPALNEKFTARSTWKNGRATLYYNDTQLHTTTYNQTNYEDGGNIWINSIQSGQYAGAGKYYKITLKKDDAVVAEFIPAKNSSNQVGFYELISKKFYSSTFTAGPEVQTPVREIHIKKDGVMRNILFSTIKVNGVMKETFRRVS